MANLGEAHKARTYSPIEDYAIIGDCHGSALVGRDGSIDWCCLGRFDAEPVFCRILDSERGGYLSVRPVADCSISRSYLGDTNVLQTVFTTEDGQVIVTDFMPVGRRQGSGNHNYVDLVAPKWLVRRVEVVRGSLDVQIKYRPAIKFAREPARLKLEPDRISTERGPTLAHDVTGWEVRGEAAETVRHLERGSGLHLVLSAETIDSALAISQVDQYLGVTLAFWREWIAYCRNRGPFETQVRRSLLAIKLLIYAPSGALAAAATTSLPEQIGGSRNWDYRYCWLRDTSFALYALAIMGYGGEARRFSEYLPRVCAATAPDLRIMYGIDGEFDLEEQQLDHLDGYRGSRPVRTGNGAYLQRQVDVYGEVFDWALLFETLGGHFNERSQGMLTALADHVAAHWREPEQGIWEMRGPPLHHVYGKIMSWVALDRAIRLVGKNQRWEQERDLIVAEVTARGHARENGHLLQAYDYPGVDAALLLAPMVSFPLTKSVLESTVAAIEAELRHGDFVYRYRSNDGLEGDEGAFLICSFWLVDAYLHLGKAAEARKLYERLIGRANDVGLFAEEIDPDGGAFLGNFPQAYTHLALIGSAAHLHLYDRLGANGLLGSYADRAKRMVTATLGWRAVWSAFKATWRVGRMFSSRRSILVFQPGRAASEQRNG